jgi:hypothetical protein
MSSDSLIHLIGLVAWFPRWQLLNAGLLSSRYLPAPILAAILDANAHIRKPQAPHQWKIKAWNNVKCNFCEKVNFFLCFLLIWPIPKSCHPVYTFTAKPLSFSPCCFSHHFENY